MPLWLLMAGAGAGLGYLQNQDRQNREDASKRASADAIRVSWARKNGQGNIPQVQYNTGPGVWGSMLQGGLAGGLQGAAIDSAMTANAANTAGTGASEFGNSAFDGGAAPKTWRGTSLMSPEEMASYRHNPSMKFSF